MNAQLNPIRTLIVDDSQDECALLNAELRSVRSVKLIGFVHDGIEAISYLRGVDQFKDRELFPYPDLLLLDFSMPRCGGIGVLQFLHRQFYRPRVVLWSNTLDQVSIPHALRLGADLVCDKPKDKCELMEIVRRIVSKAFRTAPLPPLPDKSEIICVHA
jgi:CheY-like chemotaxis protein